MKADASMCSHNYPLCKKTQSKLHFRANIYWETKYKKAHLSLLAVAWLILQRIKVINDEFEEYWDNVKR
jgi:hypothetical protein